MFEKITIASVTGHQAFAEGSLKSIVASCERLPGARGLLLLPELLPNVPDFVDQYTIKSFGYQDYAFFMIYGLHRYIKTDYVITVQDDGWILDKNSWHNDFYKYDYIGAPVHLARVVYPNGSHWLRGFQWVSHFQNPEAKINFIQNGGFSFRSRRFMELPSLLKIPFIIPAPSGISGTPAGLFWESEEQLEDVQLCITMREQLEAAGMNFAPLNIAKKFAIEHVGVGLHDITDINNVFGHHSKLRKIKNSNEIDYQIRKEDIASIYGETEITKMLETKFYKLNYAI